MNEMYCTQCGHDPLLQADNDRRNREELEAAKAEIEYIRAMNLILSNQLGEARAKIAEWKSLDDYRADFFKNALGTVSLEHIVVRWKELVARIAELEADIVNRKRLSDVDIEVMRNQQARIAELEAARRWVPVGERLPEDGNPVLAYGYSLWTAHYVKGEWYDDVMDERIYITHWMPLPAVPEVE